MIWHHIFTSILTFSHLALRSFAFLNLSHLLQFHTESYSKAIVAFNKCYESQL
jgi:hypothetical protein